MNLVLLSVNPLDKEKCDKYGYDYDGVMSGIEVFNDKLSETEYMYIDTYSYLMNNGFSTVDGLHYTDDTYRLIYNYVRSALGGGK